MFVPSYCNYHKGAMMSCNMPWWTIQSWIWLRKLAADRDVSRRSGGRLFQVTGSETAKPRL